ncbi:hypothetical protein D3C72_1931570 [compost metagenome]
MILHFSPFFLQLIIQQLRSLVEPVAVIFAGIKKDRQTFEIEGFGQDQRVPGLLGFLVRVEPIAQVSRIRPIVQPQGRAVSANLAEQIRVLESIVQRRKAAHG